MLRFLVFCLCVCCLIIMLATRCGPLKVGGRFLKPFRQMWFLWYSCHCYSLLTAPSDPQMVNITAKTSPSNAWVHLYCGTVFGGKGHISFFTSPETLLTNISPRWPAMGIFFFFKENSTLFPNCGLCMFSTRY